MILSKLRSRKGASLIVALFLLIVCSTVGSIILTAATANVGRISERAEYDRKYYEVISAARLFADKIAESELTLTIALQGGAASIACADSAADSELSNILRNDILRIYKGSDALTPATAAQYLRETFSNIGRDADYSESAPTAFAMTVREGDADTLVVNRLRALRGRGHAHERRHQFQFGQRGT